MPADMYTYIQKTYTLHGLGAHVLSEEGCRKIGFGEFWNYATTLKNNPSCTHKSKHNKVPNTEHQQKTTNTPKLRIQTFGGVAQARSQLD